MDKYRSAIKSIIRSLRNIGDLVFNILIKYNNNWKLKHKYIVNTDKLTSEYKKEIKEYWKNYTSRFNTDWHRLYYTILGVSDVRFIPDDLYYVKIDQHFNNKKMSGGVDDKNYYNIWFPDARQAKAVVRKINGFFYDANYKLIGKDEVICLCLEHSRLILKPAVGIGRSQGIEFWSSEQGSEGIIRLIIEGTDNLVVQEIIRQHKDLSIIHPSSVNTIRVISLLFKGRVHILSSVLRMGIDGCLVDNASAGGITCGIKEDGQLKDIAFSLYGVKYDKHPQGFEFSDCIVPSFDKVKELVIREQTKLAHFRLISWDIAVADDGEPVLIEANLGNGGMRIHQFNNGPLFGDLTDEVLQEVFKN